MMYDGHGMGGWGYLFMTVDALLFWGLIVGGIVVLVRYLGWSGRPETRSPAETILADRFARGEIDVEDYRQGLRILRG